MLAVHADSLCVEGDPNVLFQEDALRMLQIVRVCVQTGVPIDPTARRALLAHAVGLGEAPPALVGRELDAIVRSGRAGRALLEQPDVMCAAIPELAACRGFDQRSVYHVYDVYEHIAHVCNACSAFTAGVLLPELAWAALLHDVAKPATFSEDEDGHGHFFDHPREGALMADRILGRLQIHASVRIGAVELIRLHDERMPPTVSAIRALLRRLSQSCPGREVPLAFALLNLRRADAVAKCTSAAHWASELDRYASVLRAEVSRGPVFGTRQLAVDATDVMRVCGMAQGLGVDMQMEQLLYMVMNDELPNERNALLAWLGDDRG
ncbi:MAG: HD domain-containing protein [Atopobiaceae bacterium]|nr:HD domain-containing protein [Atopobiaceae bacterium]